MMSESESHSIEFESNTTSGYQSDLAFWYAIVDRIPAGATRLRGIRSSLYNKLQKVTNLLDKINQINSENSNIKIDAYLRSLKEAYADLYTLSDGIVDAYPPASSEYRFLRGLFGQSIDSAVSAYLYLAHNLQLDSTRSYMAGLNEAKAFKNRFSFTSPIDKDNWVGLVKSIEDEIAKKFQRYDREIDSIKTGYIDDLQLKSPVEYWVSKRDHHRTMFGRIAIALCLFVFGFGFCYLFTAFRFFGAFGTNSPPLFSFGVFGVIGLIYVWTIRVLLKVLLSHIHLAMDANERRVMIMTYLSMLEESDTHAIEARELILGSIFRTANDGLLGGDTMPSTPPVKQYFQGLAGKDS